MHDFKIAGFFVLTYNATEVRRDTVKMRIVLQRTRQKNTGLKVYPNPVDSVTYLQVEY